MLEELSSVNVSGANLYIIDKKDIFSPFFHDIVLKFLYQRFFHRSGGLRESDPPAYLFC